MKSINILFAMFLFVVASPVFAQWDTAIGIGAKQLAVTEYDRSGKQLVREQGRLPGLEGRLAYKFSEWTFIGEVELYKNSIDYRGQTQFGAPIVSTTATKLVQVRSGLSYVVNETVTAFTALEWERWYRDIRGVQTVLGLQEQSTSKRLIFGLDAQWRIPSYGQISTGAALVLARPEKVHVGFSGALDEATLDTETATGLRLAVSLHPDAYSRLELRAGYDWLRVSRSEDASVTNHGQFAGTIAQPEHTKKTITLSTRYHF